MLNYKKKKPVLKYDLNSDELLGEYSSVSVAAFEHKISVCNITNCIRKRQKSAGGFKWKYKTIKREP